MDAVKFIEERNRMCKSFGDRCKGCPAFNACEDELGCAVSQESTLNATAQLVMVEAWSAAHPHKTRQSVFLEQYPEAQIDNNGAIYVCPNEVSTAYRDAYGGCARTNILCPDCRREFWMQEG